MGMKMMTLRDNKMPLIDIWNNSQVYLGKAIVMAYGDLFMLTKMLEKISASIDPTNTIILK